MKKTIAVLLALAIIGTIIPAKVYYAPLAPDSKAIELNPRNAENYSGRSKVYEALGQDAEAEADKDEAIRLEPNLSEEYNSCGELKRRNGRYEEALADFNEAISRAAEDDAAPYYINRGSLYQELKRCDEASADFDKALSIAQTPEVKKEVEEHLAKLNQ
ncbi:MAG: tetratricopeptide repeat protein [Lachnospiraceae bacterium]|jgi:tetratricopeptide (TPR) repeat protein|nr:tetratricopeptide repeat protein [Lachnospiraceae bacterium]